MCPSIVVLQSPTPSASVIPSSGTLHAKAHTATLLVGGIALHLLADLDVDIEELAHAAVQTDRLALVQIAFPVIDRDTLLGAGLGQASERLANTSSRNIGLISRPLEPQSSHSPVEHVRDHVDFGLGSSDLLLRGHLGLAAEKERHGEYEGR